MQDISFDDLRNQAIGTVEVVSALKIEVLLETNAPQTTAINTGVPTVFPRINSYALIPNEAGALVGLVTWLGTKQAQYPKRKGYNDFDLVDLPFPLRQIHLRPVGTLKKQEGSIYEFHRGVYTFPSISDVVVLPTPNQLSSIIETADSSAEIQVGTAPIAGGASIRVNPDKLFGKHCAILGNTGSGKSCTVAGLIRWSMESAKANLDKDTKQVNARFIVIDPNGEYSKTFDDIDEGRATRKFSVRLAEKDVAQLRVPVWLWNSMEWTSIAQAGPGIQQPVLKNALRNTRTGFGNLNPRSILRRNLRGLLEDLKRYQSSGLAVYSDFRQRQDLGNLLFVSTSWLTSTAHGLDITLSVIPNLQQIRRNFPLNNGMYPAFDPIQVENLIPLLENDVNSIEGIEEEKTSLSEDTPVPFDQEDFVNQLTAAGQTKETYQFVEYMVNRITTMLNDVRSSSVISTEPKLTLVDWLNSYIGTSQGESGQIAIIDLSLVPTEIVHIIVAVLARLIFEAHQRYRREYGKILPTTLVLEEAHNFLIRYQLSSSPSTSIMCTNVFEKIAKEGRKFGVGLLISSQRPSELSQTVLSQCNTFFLHRIVNDQDQLSVKSLLPDNLGEILDELPILPTQNAFVLGSAFPLPLLIEMRSLAEEHQPHSWDPDFWKTWTGSSDRPVDWAKIVEAWYEEGGYSFNQQEGTDPLTPTT